MRNEQCPEPDSNLYRLTTKPQVRALTCGFLSESARLGPTRPVSARLNPPQPTFGVPTGTPLHTAGNTHPAQGRGTWPKPVPVPHAAKAVYVPTVRPENVMS
ncbi:hypothetical protein GCM10009549_13930 [Streptomyces thermoalcalitolerans]|uniref:Uncharacterized protein n=1 Tax=Streptomyces thermoalcalitolerans TaxID=65605 RepID=A0ABN1NI15_9ACTN